MWIKRPKVNRPILRQNRFEGQAWGWLTWMETEMGANRCWAVLSDLTRATASRVSSADVQRGTPPRIPADPGLFSDRLFRRGNKISQPLFAGEPRGLIEDQDRVIFGG